MNGSTCERNSARELTPEQQEIKRLREELDKAQKQSLAFAADLAKGYSQERRQTRILEKTNEQLSRSAKLATLGEMLASIAHDVNNVITPITGYAGMLQRMPDLPPKGKTCVVRIQHAIDRAAVMLTSLANYNADLGAARSAIDMASVVNAAVALLEYSMARHSVRVEVYLDKGLPKVVANSGQIEQVLVNLLVNAQHAMQPNGGVISIHARRIEMGVRLSVSDHGCGIPKEILPRIFDPFFTTKKDGKGNGLGLFSCHQIIEAHDGTIDASSDEGRGTVFHIALPAWTHADPEAAAS